MEMSKQTDAQQKTVTLKLVIHHVWLRHMDKDEETER